MFTITTDQYVKDEGNEGKTFFTFTVTATDIFETGEFANGNQVKLHIQLLEKGMDSADGLKLVNDEGHGFETVSANSGFLVMDSEKDFKGSTTEEVHNPLLKTTDKVTTSTYSKTFKVEITGDTDIEAHEMFGVAITSGWMMQDGKVTSETASEHDSVPRGNFKVAEYALQVVRNDDGDALPGDASLMALRAQIESVIGDTEAFDAAKKKLGEDIKGASQTQPEPKEDPNKKTAEEEEAALDAFIQDIQDKLKEAEEKGDAARTDDLEALLEGALKEKEKKFGADAGNDAKDGKIKYEGDEEDGFSDQFVELLLDIYYGDDVPPAGDGLLFANEGEIGTVGHGASDGAYWDWDGAA